MVHIYFTPFDNRPEGMSEATFWGKAETIAEAARMTKFSRVSLHKWKRDGCPAFAADGTIDLAALTTWLRENCLGTRNAESTYRSPPAPTFFKGGRDFASDLDGVHSAAMRFLHILKDAGHAEAAEKWRSVFYDQIRPVIDEYIAHLEQTGLAEPLGD